MARRKKKIRFKDLPKPIKIRKIITWVFMAIGIGCLGYFAFYVKQADDTQSNYEHLSDLKGTDYTKNKNNKKTLVVHLHIFLKGQLPHIFFLLLSLRNTILFPQ